MRKRRRSALAAGRECPHHGDDALAQKEKKENQHTEKVCIDCRRKLPEGHPYGYCPAREDSGYF